MEQNTPSKKTLRTTFTDVLLLLEIFFWNEQKSCVPFTFPPDFPKTFCKWKTTNMFNHQWDFSEHKQILVEHCPMIDSYLPQFAIKKRQSTVLFLIIINAQAYKITLDL